MAETWWNIWGKVGERSNRTLNTGQKKAPFNPGGPKGKYTDKGELYYYTRPDGTPITGSTWSLKDLAYPLNLPFGGKDPTEGLEKGTDAYNAAVQDKWKFASWFFNQMPTEALLPGMKAGSAARGKYFYKPPTPKKSMINVTPKQTPVKGEIPKYSSGPIVQTTEGTFYRPTKRLASQFAWTEIPISKSQQNKLIEERDIQTANINVQQGKITERKAKGKSYDTQARVMRRHQGTPTPTVADLARPFVKDSPVKDFSTRDVIVAYDKKTAAQKKEGAKIKKEHGLEATVDDHHIIQSFDSSEIGRLVREWNDPNQAADFYVWMVKEYKILAGDYDLNSAKLPTGPHRLKGGLHNVLKRFGFEDYWRELAVNNPMGLSKPELKEAFSIYMDEVLYPTMRLMKHLVDKHPAKGKYEHKGQYIPDYLIQDANARLRHLQSKYDPGKLRSTQAGKEQALDDLHTLASQQGLDTGSLQWLHTKDGPVYSRTGFTKLPDEVESIWSSIKESKPWKTR